MVFPPTPQMLGDFLRQQALQHRLLSSPFIRWLAERGGLQQVLPILQQAMGAENLPSFAQTLMSVAAPGTGILLNGLEQAQAAAQPVGRSLEAASPQMFRDLANMLNAIIQGHQANTDAFRARIRQMAGQAMVPPTPGMPGRPF